MDPFEAAKRSVLATSATATAKTAIPVAPPVTVKARPMPTLTSVQLGNLLDALLNGGAVTTTTEGGSLISGTVKSLAVEISANTTPTVLASIRTNVGRENIQRFVISGGFSTSAEAIANPSGMTKDELIQSFGKNIMSIEAIDDTQTRFMVSPKGQRAMLVTPQS